MKDLILALRYHGEALRNNAGYRQKWADKKDECINPEIVTSFSSDERKWIEDQTKKLLEELKSP